MLLRSRNNNDLTAKYPAITKALTILPDETVLDGEVVAIDQSGRPSFNARRRSIALSPSELTAVARLQSAENRPPLARSAQFFAMLIAELRQIHITLGRVGGGGSICALWRYSGMNIFIRNISKRSEYTRTLPHTLPLRTGFSIPSTALLRPSDKSVSKASSLASSKGPGIFRVRQPPIAEQSLSGGNAASVIPHGVIWLGAILGASCVPGCTANRL